MTDVVLVRWPAEAERRDALRAEGRPRLLLVDGPSPPPVVSNCLEDWVRVPAAEEDVWARVAALSARAHAHAEAERPSAPTLDVDGVLRRAGRWVHLPPVEARLTGALLDRAGAVVSRDALARAGWPDGIPGRNVLDVHILRLRRRVEPLGVVIHTVRARGYLLEASDARQAFVRYA